MKGEKQEVKDSKHLISHIQSQYTRFSKGQKLIAQYILKNYDKVAFMTACKLGEEVGVSESTVVRFANALGYSGYPKLQDALQELIKNKLTTVQRVDMVTEFNDDSAILKKILKSDMDNIKETLDGIDEKAFEGNTNVTFIKVGIKTENDGTKGTIWGAENSYLKAY